MTTTRTARRLGLSFFLVSLVSCLVSHSSAQDPGKSCKLRWFGQSMFQLETSAGKFVVFDPHAIPEFGRHVVKADVVVCSHLHNDHTTMAQIADPKSARVFYGLEETKKGRPPEWKKIDEKVGQIHIRTVGTYHDANEGLSRGKNSIFVVEADGLVFCHLGDLGHDLTAAQVKAIGKVDVLMVPVGGIYTINGGQAKRAVEQLKPRLFVLPMHYGVPGYDALLSADEFLDGQPNVKKLTDTNELVIPLDAKPDKPTVVLLGWEKKDAPAKPKKN
jgi:L-ascorbate metabolism protein UlaG (beta-lactamase superfamily)